MARAYGHKRRLCAPARDPRSASLFQPGCASFPLPGVAGNYRRVARLIFDTTGLEQLGTACLASGARNLTGAAGSGSCAAKQRREPRHLRFDWHVPARYFMANECGQRPNVPLPFNFTHTVACEQWIPFHHNLVGRPWRAWLRPRADCASPATGGPL